MRVLFDYQAFQNQRYGGVSRCFAQLAANLPEDVDFEIAVKESDNAYLHELGLVEGLRHARFSRSTFLGGVDSAWKEFLYNAMNYMPFVQTTKVANRRFAVSCLEKGGFDIFHPTFFDNYFLPHLHGRPFVLTVHDLIADRMPEYDNRSDSQIADRNRLLDAAAHIVAVSRNTADDLVGLLGVDRSKISVIYHAGPSVDPAALGRETPVVEGKYLLFVGARSSAYKNFVPFVKSVKPLLEKFGLRIVCTGTPFTAQEQALFAGLGIAGRMVHVPASSAQLYNLYHFAQAFVFPSAYEGFGIPVLEAFACGCPVLLNDASCFPEIAGDAAAYFTMESLTEVLDAFLTDRDDAAGELVRKGFIRLQEFSWKRSAEQLASVYRSCVSR